MDRKMDKYIKLEDAIDLFWTVDPENNGDDGCTVVLKCGSYDSNEIETLLSELPTIEIAPPNEPLTIEQLREMDGEPVWIVEQPDWGHWELSADAEDYLANRDQDFYGLKHDDPAGRYGLHVLGWLAYRRPPEGEEERHGD